MAEERVLDITRDGRRFVKIWLPGETPWGEVLAENEDGSLVVRIDNKVAGDYTAREHAEFIAALFGNDAKPDYSRDRRLHSFKYNDVVRVSSEDGVLVVVGVTKH